jgi:hypothetical protein
MATQAKENEACLKITLLVLFIIQTLNLEDRSCNMIFSSNLYEYSECFE